jgi:GNAT superfamily N-acetyltransferase
MKKSTIKIRLMKVEDFNAVVRIDEKVLNASRSEYYRLKFETAVQYIGEYGISREKATLEILGVDPDYQHKGIGKQLINEFMDHLKALGVKKINTLVDEKDTKLTHFFSANQFGPSKTINLERSL